MLLPPSDVIADEQHDVPTTISRSANKTLEKVFRVFYSIYQASRSVMAATTAL